MSDLISLWHPDLPFPLIAQLNLPDRIEHRIIHRGRSGAAFLHESAIIRHGDQIIVAWNQSPTGESEQGTVIQWISSTDDGQTWSAAQVLAPAMEASEQCWESVQLLSESGRLWAFVGQVHTQPRTTQNAGGRTVIFCLNDAGLWRVEGAIEEFHPLSQPQRMDDGNWIMGGQESLCYPRVAISEGGNFTRWTVVQIASAPNDNIRYPEPSLSVSGAEISAYIRTGNEMLLTSVSDDFGRSWTPAAASNLKAASSKTCAGVFSNGQHFLAFNLRGQGEEYGDRDVLVVAVSAVGEKLLRKVVVIRKGRAPEPRIPGSCKKPEWSYPSVMEWGGNIYVTYSITKEDCGLSILPLKEFAV